MTARLQEGPVFTPVPGLEVVASCVHTAAKSRSFNISPDGNVSGVWFKINRSPHCEFGPMTVPPFLIRPAMIFSSPTKSADY